MVDQSTTTTGCNNYCMYRLPCGYCKEMNSMCPFGSGYMKITCATSGTCGVTSGSGVDVTFGSDNNSVHVINKAENVII